MKFDKPEGANPIDRMKVVGQAKDRIDGPLKVTGLARYAYERRDAVPDAVYGHVIGSAIAKGRIRTLDTRDALAAHGVLGVVTARDVGPMGVGELFRATVLGGPDIQHYNQAIGVVVAETFEQARAAAALVRVDYARQSGRFDLAAQIGTAVAHPRFPDTARGDFAKAFADAPVRLDTRYTTPDQSHAAMEPHATIASWQGDRVTLWTSQQVVFWARRDLAKILNIPIDRIRMVASFVGGGFGGKASVLADAVMAALASRAVGRPVKIAIGRPLIANMGTHRPATVQRIRIGATADGRITAFGHQSWSGNLHADGAAEAATIPTPLMYAGDHRATQHRMAVLDLPEGNAMRAPGEAPGMLAIESAMDELADQLGMDPVELRIRNDTRVNPTEPDKPFSTRNLVQCLQTGAARFGWDKRVAKPGGRREGAWLIGMGVAAAVRGARVRNSSARVRLAVDGRVIVETDMTDIGTGSYTILGQTAAEMMGVELDRVVVRLGDSDYPLSVGSIGQRGATSSTSALYAACVKLREQVAQRLGFNGTDVDFADGVVRSGNRRVALVDAAKAGELVAEDILEFDEAMSKTYEQAAFGAHFVEVAIHAMTGELRLRRMLAVCAAGRILNPKTARSQVIGAMTMGAGGALMEALAIDKRFGFFVNHDLASYEVPVHADIPHTEAIFIDEVDPTISPMKAKGVGELGMTGIGAAIANAVYNATGARVRDFPITLDTYLDRLPPIA
ncbi:xanthine dehydrogenase family protein molybdopterin-binding subunit [Sphingomonas ginsenosidivorax]|uniref:Xanthine dehydrogenase family protein molybdopterin-binding subunit n=1 Tax=Sphingomonas ginsenosidivorax TaxID=862135 RepID=A0A5C6UFQ1_9SPHN|nr:aldehyde oxidoreductase molybdenum-binding subunit PaoC [Sphingomonas ginsenosidivorax]TXC71081.1 xanthine dehydrogenase family protein molybdopterin-binding subunit [Sphingomonas ginsenosidivorax]